VPQRGDGKAFADVPKDVKALPLLQLKKLKY
jgi:hypothetical protein